MHRAVAIKVGLTKAVITCCCNACHLEPPAPPHSMRCSSLCPRIALRRMFLLVKPSNTMLLPSLLFHRSSYIHTLHDAASIVLLLQLVPCFRQLLPMRHTILCLAAVRQAAAAPRQHMLACFQGALSCLLPSLLLHTPCLPWLIDRYDARQLQRLLLLPLWPAGLVNIIQFAIAAAVMIAIKYALVLGCVCTCL